MTMQPIRTSDKLHALASPKASLRESHPPKARLAFSNHNCATRTNMLHKFKIDQKVEFSPPRGIYVAQGTYSVTKLLPERAGEFEYSVKNSQEAFERIARESELSPELPNTGARYHRRIG